MAKWAAVALGAPGCVVAVATLVALILAVFDRPPMWPREYAFNLAEAAAARDEAEVVRLIEGGHDPNGRYAVRPGLIFDRTTRLTPLEAAIAGNAPDVFRQLIARGAMLDAGLWTYLRCIGEDSRVAPVLDQHRPEGAVLSCDGVRAPWNDAV
jgi:hypothetical protein